MIELKVAQFPLKVAPKVAIAILSKKLHVIKITKKLPNTGASFCKKICHTSPLKKS